MITPTPPLSPSSGSDRSQQSSPEYVEHGPVPGQPHKFSNSPLSDSPYTTPQRIPNLRRAGMGTDDINKARTEFRELKRDKREIIESARKIIKSAHKLEQFIYKLENNPYFADRGTVHFRKRAASPTDDYYTHTESGPLNTLGDLVGSPSQSGNGNRTQQQARLAAEQARLAAERARNAAERARRGTVKSGSRFRI